MTADPPLIAVVLPSKERFSPQASGAVALMVHRQTQAASHYRRIVIGATCDAPYDDVAFAPVTPHFLPGTGGRRYGEAVARMLRGPALIEVHNRADLAVLLARRLPQARVGLFIHNDPTTMHGLRRAGEVRAATAHLAGAVCVSQFLADRLRAVAPDLPVTVLPNGVVLPPPIEGDREKLVLFVGRLVADKGADSFVEACREALPQMPGWRAEMIGADRFGPHSKITPFMADLIPRAAAAGVRLAGYQPHDEAMQAMARAAIVVVPSRWQEPFGLSALEAMAHGAALICSGRGGLGEVVGDAALPCDPDQPETIAAAMLTLANDENLRAEMAEAGPARAAQFDLRVTQIGLDTWRDGLLRTAGAPI
jgi:UDP-glucose:(glucosyl)LPS alpha-1,2-glucosyltransferase